VHPIFTISASGFNFTVILKVGRQRLSQKNIRVAKLGKKLFLNSNI
jgi:hypothetical protein